MMRRALGIALAGLLLAAPAVADDGPRNSPDGDCPGCAADGDMPLNAGDDAIDDGSDEDLSAGVGKKYNQRQCVTYARLLAQQQTGIDIQQALRARGCEN